MNHCVPSFEMEEDGSITTNRSKKSSTAEAKIMELVWQNGEVVTQSQNHRSPRKSNLGGASAEQREIRSDEETAANHQLFMQEDEMASWLQYPLDDSSFDRDFYAGLLGPAAPSAPVATAVAAVAPPPPMPPPRRVEPSMESPPPQQKYQNFSHFSRLKGRIESGPSSSNKAGKVSTIEDSNETPLTTGLESRVLWGADSTPLVSGGNIGYSIPAAAANTSPAACELTVSYAGGSGASAVSAEPMQKMTGTTATATEDRKRKATEIDDGECQSEKDVESESAHAKKQAHGSTSTKRSRAAEVHNLSERRRRDRINEKMKALQELIPCCNKSDKASMLDEAIEYLKSLQMQVQMMSMGCGMVPMMFPGVQQYMSPMGMGLGMGMNRPMVPFWSVLLGSALQNPAAEVHLAPRFPMPSFHMPSVPPSDPSRMQATTQSDVMRSSIASQNLNQSQVSNFSSYQQYLGIHQPQVPLTQNQAVVQPNPNKPNSSGEVGNPDNGQSD